MFEIFKNKRIIVTGHTGFKGSWLTAFLSTYECKIYGLSKDIPTKPSHFKLLNFKNKKAMNEFSKFKLMSPMSAEASVVRSYLDWVSNLPWKKKLAHCAQVDVKKCYSWLKSKSPLMP